MNEQLIAELTKQVHRNDEAFQQLKHILRIPRLYHHYVSAMKEVMDKQQLKIYLESKGQPRLGEESSLNDYEKKCIQTALQL